MGRRSGCRILNKQRANRQIARGPVGLWAAVLVAMLLFAGCGVDRTLDGTALEADIAAQLLPEYPGAIRSVSCPNSSEPMPGQTVLCVATLGAQVLDVNVVIGGVEDALTTTAAVDGRIVAINEVAALLAATFGDEIGLVTSVDCGQAVMVLDVDDAVICEATDPSGVTRAFDVRVDDAGLVTLDIR